MKAACLPIFSLALALLTVSGGCLFVPATQLATCRSTNQTLAEQNRAQLAEIENLKVHSRNTEDQLIRTEEELATLEEQVGLDRRQLANYRQERSELHEQAKTLLSGSVHLPPGVARQLVELSRRHPELNFDPATGVSKLQSDVLFETGRAELKPGVEEMLKELVKLLNLPEASQLKVMVVGHTDNRRIAKRPARDMYLNNFHLSTARAHAVADQMRKLGFAEQRMGVAGFGPHQPIAPNVTSSDRRKNRRVEIFVLGRDVPVVGWTESIPSVY